MRIAVPTEIKNNENRVALTDEGAHELIHAGHEVFVQSGAGLGSLITDEAYRAAGATVLEAAEQTWAAGELLLKVKEPVAEEYRYLRADQTVFAYLHLAADRPLTDALVASGTTAIAYETVQLNDRSLPLLAPMSEIAGRLAAQVGAEQLLTVNGGRGVLLSGVPGVTRAEVVVIGAGVAGFNAARIAAGLGANVQVFDIDIPRLRHIDELMGHAVQTRVSGKMALARAVAEADLVIGSVLIPGARAPKLVTDEMVAGMKAGSVLIDIAIDQGGCFENSRPTTYQDPTFRVHGSTYYCVANMPGAVPSTATRALCNATLPFTLRLANAGVEQALRADPALSRGLNTMAGALTNAGVAAAHGLAAVEPAAALG